MSKGKLSLFDTMEQALGSRVGTGGVFANIRQILRTEIPVGKRARVADCARLMIDRKGWNYRKAYNYVRNAVGSDKSFKIESGVVTRIR